MIALAVALGACRAPRVEEPAPEPGEVHEVPDGASVGGTSAAATPTSTATPTSSWVSGHRTTPRFDEAGVRPEVVAVVLPLSGAYAALGRAVRPAIELAAEAGRPRFVFLDSKGTPEGASAAVDEAATRGAVLVMGPLGGGEAHAAARRAVERGLPIALLAPDDADAAPREGVVRLVPSAAAEARLTAALVVEQGHDTIGIFAPDDEQGAAQAEAFASAATAAGARVTRRALYDPTAAQLEPAIKRFLGLVPAQNPRLAKHLRRAGKDGWKTFSPDIDFDLLYLPDEHTRAALIAAYLPYFNVEVRNQDVMDTLSLREKHGGRLPSVVQLLGSSAWHHPSLTLAGGAAVDGALLVARCRGAAGDDAASDAGAELIAAYQARVGSPPGTLALQAHDAARLVAGALAAAGGGGRVRVAAALAGATLEDGACGPTRVGPRGQLERDIALLRVDGAALVPDAR